MLFQCEQKLLSLLLLSLKKYHMFSLKNAIFSLSRILISWQRVFPSNLKIVVAFCKRTVVIFEGVRTKIWSVIVDVTSHMFYD